MDKADDTLLLLNDYKIICIYGTINVYQALDYDHIIKYQVGCPYCGSEPVKYGRYIQGSGWAYHENACGTLAATITRYGVISLSGQTSACIMISSICVTPPEDII
jgi:hypothetical protein